MGFLADKVRHARMTAGLSQSQLAAKLGELPPNYTKMETSKRAISDATLEKLANIPELGLTLHQLQCWKLIDEYPPELIEMAHKMLEEGK